MRFHVATPRIIAASLLTMLALAACGPKDAPNQDSLTQAQAAGTVTEFKVAEVQMGKAIGADMKVTTAATQFMPRDTIYLSVSTTGVAQDASLMLMVSSVTDPADTLNTVHDNKTISPSGPSVTEFHFAKPAGFKVGKYKAEVFLNGGFADVKEFEVIKGN